MGGGLIGPPPFAFSPDTRHSSPKWQSVVNISENRFNVSNFMIPIQMKNKDVPLCGTSLFFIYIFPRRGFCSVQKICGYSTNTTGL